MPEIEIRPIKKSDLPALARMDARYETSHVWQLERVTDETQVTVSLRLARLPRNVRVDYPKPSSSINQEWMDQALVLAAYLQDEPVGFVRTSERIVPNTIWITDLVVKEDERRQGIATALVLAVHDWALHRNIKLITIEMQSKNYPGIQLAHKLGYEFSGYIDHYYSNRDIAIIFSGSVR
ncbi:MAG: GNAT family N-acetyltransferase [Anaerolineaceae bacterium]